MIYTFASNRQLSFIISVGGRNMLVSFGSRNQAGVAAFMTTDEKVASVIRRHALSRRGIILETTKPEILAAKPQGTVKHADEAPGKKAETNAEDRGETATREQTEAQGTGETAIREQVNEQVAGEAADEVLGNVAGQREYDNYTVAREAICKEFGIKKTDVRNPAALEQVAKEHGITIIYKNAN